MDGRHKLVVIYNGTQAIRSLDFLVSLQSAIDIEILSLASEETFSSYRLSIPVKIFENVENLPGYLRGLEKFVQGADLVLAFGSYDMTCYQAAKTCEKLKIPFYVLTNPDEPYSQRCSPEQSAVHGQLIPLADKFLVFANHAREALNIEGVSYDKIWKLRPFFSQEKLIFEEAARMRFRDYIGIPNDCILALIQNLNDLDCLRSILFALRLVLQNNRDLAERFRLILANCLLDMDYRYLICDLGLSKQVLILNQNISSFESDLYCACDLAIDCALPGQSEYCDFWLMEAVRTGLCSISIGNSAIAEHAQELGIIHFEQLNNFQQLAVSIEKTLTQLVQDPIKNRSFKDNWQVYLSQNVGEELLTMILRDLTGQEDNYGLARKHFDHVTATVHNLLERAEWARAESLLQDWESMSSTLSLEQRTRLYCLKGDVLFSQSKFEEALPAYEKALKLDTSCWQAMLGLAKVSVLSHQDEDAITFYRKALAVCPNLAAAFEGIGFIHRRNSLYQEAIYWLNRALLLDPSNTRVLLQLTQACLESDEDGKAVEVLEQARSTVGDHPSLIMAMGQIYLRMGKVEQGQELVNRALALSGDLQKDQLAS